jgi:hypothetical protein
VAPAPTAVGRHDLATRGVLATGVVLGLGLASILVSSIAASQVRLGLARNIVFTFEVSEQKSCLAASFGG